MGISFAELVSPIPTHRPAKGRDPQYPGVGFIAGYSVQETVLSGKSMRKKSLPNCFDSIQSFEKIGLTISVFADNNDDARGNKTSPIQ